MSSSSNNFKDIANEISNKLKELNKVKNEISASMSDKFSTVGNAIKDDFSNKIEDLNRIKNDISSTLQEGTKTIKDNLKNEFSEEISKLTNAKEQFQSEFAKGKANYKYEPGKGKNSEQEGVASAQEGDSPTEGGGNASISDAIKNIGLGTIIASAINSLLSAEALQEPINNLGTAIKGMFESILGGSGEDNPFSSITSVISDGINLVIELIGYLSPVAETVGNFLSMGFNLASQAVGFLCESLSSAIEYLRANKEELMLVVGVIGALAAGIGIYIALANISTITTKLSTLATSLYSAAMNIANGAISAFNTVMMFVNSTTGKWTFIIMGVIAGIYLLVKNWDTLKQAASNACQWIGEKVRGLASGVLNFFSPILDPILNKFNLISQGISKVFNFITGLFNKVLKPNIKMPKIDITGKFSLNPLQVPKFGIGWYQTGGIFTGPSVIGVGENGDEAVLPLSNKRRMKPFANAVASMMALDNTSGSSNNKGVTINIDNMSVRNDMDIKKIAEEINRLTARENRKLGLI